MERVRKKGAARPEQALQKAVLSHLQKRGAPGIFYFHVPNGGYRKPVEASILKGQGVVAGVPDLLILHRGYLYGLELKDVRGKVSVAQESTLACMAAAGARVTVANGLDAALQFLEEHKLVIGRMT